MPRAEQIQQSREFVRHQICEFPQIIEGDPHSWWHATAKLLLNFRRQLQEYSNPDVRDYFDPQIAALLEQKEFPQKTNFLPLSEMINNQPDRFFSESRLIKGEDCIILHVKHPTEDFWQEIPLPKNRK